ETDGAAAIAKGDAVFAEDPEFEGQIRQLVRVTDRLPKSPHVFAARGIRANMRQLGVFLRNMSVVIGAVPGLEERSSRWHRLLLFNPILPIHAIGVILRRYHELACRFGARLPSASGSEFCDPLCEQPRPRRREDPQ